MRCLGRCRLARHMLSLAAVAAAGSCGGDSAGVTPLASVSLVASTQSAFMNDTLTTTSIVLTASATGGRLQWQVDHTPAWLTVSPTQGTITDTPVRVTLSAPQLATMDPGTLNDYVDFISNGGTAHVSVTATVVANPQVQLSSNTITIPATSNTAAVTLTNSGNGTLSWNAVVSPASVVVAPTSGFLSKGQATTLTLTADKGPLAVGTTPATLTIKSNARKGDAAFPVSVVVSASPQSDANVGRLVYTTNVSARSFYLRNIGKGPLSWAAQPGATWLTTSPATGLIAAGDSSLVSVTINRPLAPPGDAAATLTIVGGDTPLVLSVVLASSAGFPLGLTVLDHRVIDAEFSQASGIIVTVSANPSQLNIIDVETARVSHVALALAPTCVAVRSDGLYAAVGHDGYISYVDLTTKTVLRSYAVTTTVLDVVLPKNGWVYAFPLHDQWESIRNVELATGVETRSGTIYAGVLARLHPSGKTIYGAWNGLSPTNIDKFDISNGVAKPLWESPYWGEHDFGGLEWFTEDGARMIARSGEVFRASDAQAQDMYYAGSLAGSGQLRWAGDSRAKARLFAFSASASLGTSLRVYDAAFMAFMGTVPLPSFATANGPAQALGYYVFADVTGDHLYALVKAPDTSGLSADWGLVVLDGTKLP